MAEYIKYRPFYASYLLTFLILSNVYGSQLYSNINAPHYDKPIDTLEDVLQIVRTGSHTILVPTGSVIMTKKTDPVYQLIANHAKSLIKDLQQDQIVKLIESNRKYVFPNSRTALQLQRSLYSTKSLHIGSEGLKSEMGGFVLAKMSNLTRPFNTMLKSWREMGIIEELNKNTTELLKRQLKQRNAINRRHINQHKSQLNEALKSSQTMTVFSLYFGSLSICN